MAMEGVGDTERARASALPRAALLLVEVLPSPCPWLGVSAQNITMPTAVQPHEFQESKLVTHGVDLNRVVK